MQDVQLSYLSQLMEDYKQLVRHTQQAQLNQLQQKGYETGAFCHVQAQDLRLDEVSQLIQHIQLLTTDG